MDIGLCLIFLNFLRPLFKSLDNRYKTLSLLDIKFRVTCDESKMNLNIAKFQIIVMFPH